jgi:ribosomal protein S18 acetylase RimI-like enzyme
MNARFKPPTLEHATSVLTLAFSADPPTRWVFSDPYDYLTHFPEFVRALGGRAFEHDTADSLDGCAAVALWLPPGAGPDEEALAGLIQRAVSKNLLGDAFSIFEQMGGYHPAEPHWYLPFIGVDPARQGAGYGSELMKHMLERCDAERTPAYLENSNPRNIPFYERLGFERLGVIKAGTVPEIVPMLRKSR